jgi:spore germination cell wall hydrolase CwlJ-like protein
MKGFGMIETLFANALMCMAINIYHEARNESVIGQIAVGQVVMNRVDDARFPNTVCEVITHGKHYTTKDGARYPVKDRCHFSWYCDGLADVPFNNKAFEESQEIAAMVLEGWTGTFLEGATHYHADYVFPTWAAHHTKIVKIDSHIFYRWD